MKSLEDKIIRKVYQEETKRTAAGIATRIFLILFFITAFLLMAEIIREQLAEQDTFDLFQLFQQDSETIRKYFADVVYMIFQELPKASLIILFIIGIIAGYLILKTVQNYERIKNKVRSIISFWFKKSA